MERLRYEPFGERLAPEGEAALPSRASKYLLWAGTGLFWSLVGAIVIARAGLLRLGLQARATEVLETNVCLPAVGQGALGVECRETDTATRELLAALHDTDTATCVAAERGVLVAVEGDCKTPLGAHARRVGARMHLQAFVAQPDGSGMKRGQRDVPWPATESQARELGGVLGRSLL